jgi:hypothetical protein
VTEVLLAVWKFEVPVRDRFEIEMPVGARLLTVQTQNGRPHLWALVNPHAETETRVFWVMGTGHQAADLDGAEYVGTFQMLGGQYVWHLFEWVER